MQAEVRKIEMERESEARKIEIEREAEVRKIEMGRESEEEHFQNEIKRLRQEMDMELQRNALQLTKEERDMQIECNKIISDLLQSEAGRLAVYPEEMFKVLREELKVKFADKKEVLRMYELLVNNKQSYTAGQANAFRAAMKQILGEKFILGDEGDEITAMDYNKLLDGTKDEKKEGEETKYEYKTTESSEEETKAEDDAGNQKGDVEENSNETSKLNEGETKPEENA